MDKAALFARTRTKRARRLFDGGAGTASTTQRSPWAHIVSKTAKEFRKRHRAYCGVCGVVNTIQRNDLAQCD